jgi:energy-coupling factor transport system permease protein
MRLSVFVDAPSPLHRLDPRVKLAVIAFFSVSQLLFNQPVFLSWSFLALVLLAALGRVLKHYLVGTFLVVVVGGLSFFMWPLVLRMRGFAGADVWIYAAGMGLRVTNILLMGLLVLLTSRTEEILAGLARLYVRVPGLGRVGLPFPAIFALGLTFRLVPALLATANHVVEAQRLRGLRYDEGGLIARARRYVPLLVPILAGSLRSATRMSWALEAKGFGSPRPRTSFMVLRMRGADWAGLVLAMAWLVGAIILRIHGVGYREYAGF